MGPRYVALDLETTGLDADTNEIIEVGAIAFDLDETLGEFQTLVRPYRSPPYQIERLTGISAAELEVAPHFAAIAGDLRKFIDTAAIVGQNPAFDLAFLERAGIRPSGLAFDTYDLAQVLLPGLGEYSLRAIAAELDVAFPIRHRAMADAVAARCVFLALRQRLASLPRWLLEEIERLAAPFNWSVGGLVRQVMAETGPLRAAAPGLTATELLAKVEAIPRALTPTEAPEPVSEDEVIRLLGRAAALPGAFPDFEHRPQQVEMAAAITRVLNDGGNLVVEAGTGIGKSLAYLLPAALHALRNQKRVVVSTDTIGLQEQLTAKDLPAVKALVEAGDGQELRIAQLKGRRNYLCLLRWSAVRQAAPATAEEARLRARLLVWLQGTQTGDRAELNLHWSFDQVWSRLSAENTACLQMPCPFVKQGTCFLLRARRRAESAHVLVVNHALLLSDIAASGRVLPAYSHLIIDEAHNLEDEATECLSFRATAADIEDFLDRIGRRAGDRGGLTGSLMEAMRGASDILGPAAYLAGLGSALAASAARVRSRVGEPFRLLSTVLRDLSQAERDSDDRLLVTRATRVQPVWSDVQIAAENLDLTLAELASLLADLSGALSSGNLGLPGYEAIEAEVSDLLQAALGFRAGLGAALLKEESSLICWLERSRSTGEAVVCTAPLQVADILRTDLFEAKDMVVLTSATLSAEGRFDFLRQRVGLDESEELLLGSPFDYERSTLIALPSDLPEPNEPDFAFASAELLIEACRASQGRALVLFTSYGALNAAYDQIKAPLEGEGILVLAHGTDGAPRQLLAALRDNPRTVILGTASFWEGVDVAGEALSLLVIARLPFAVPTDPIYQARSALYDEPFEEYALPQAVLRFRQGFGRLIRTKSDRGAVIVLDRRIRSRKYGEAFLRSLPRCKVRDLASRNVAAAVAEWLA